MPNPSGSVFVRCSHFRWSYSSSSASVRRHFCKGSRQWPTIRPPSPAPTPADLISTRAARPRSPVRAVGYCMPCEVVPYGRHRQAGRDCLAARGPPPYRIRGPRAETTRVNALFELRTLQNCHAPRHRRGHSQACAGCECEARCTRLALNQLLRLLQRPAASIRCVQLLVDSCAIRSGFVCGIRRRGSANGPTVACGHRSRLDRHRLRPLFAAVERARPGTRRLGHPP